MKEGFRVKLYQQHFERVNYNIHTRHVKIHFMSPRIRPIGTKRSTINSSCRPKSVDLAYRIQTFGVEWHGSRHSARRGNLICFPVSRVYSFIGGGPNSIAKLDVDFPIQFGWNFPQDPPLNPSSSVGVVLFSTYSD